MAATIKFGANVSQYVSSVKQAENATSKFGSTVDKAAAAAVAAFAGLTIQSIRLAAVFDQQARIVQNIIGLTDQQRQQIQGLALDLAEYSGANADEFLKASQDALRYGDSITEVADELLLVAGASNAYGVEVEKLNSVLQKQSNQWGLAEESILAWAAAAGKLAGGDIAGLLDRLPNVAVAAKEVGADFKSITFLLAGTSRQMRNARKAASGLEMLFLELADSQTIASKALKDELGTTFEGLVEQSGGLFGALEALENTFGNRINDLFGTGAVQAFNAFMSEWDVITAEAQIGLDIRTADLEQDIINSTTSLQEGFNSLRQSWNSFRIELVDAEGPLKDAVNAITELLQDDEFKRAFFNLAEAMIDVSVPMLTLAAELAKFGGRELPGTDISLIDTAIVAYAATKAAKLVTGAVRGTAGTAGAAAEGVASAGTGIVSRAAQAVRGGALKAGLRGGIGAAGAGLVADFAFEEAYGKDIESAFTEDVLSPLGKLARSQTGVEENAGGIFGTNRIPDITKPFDDTQYGFIGSYFNPESFSNDMSEAVADAVEKAQVAEAIETGFENATSSYDLIPFHSGLDGDRFAKFAESARTAQRDSLKQDITGLVAEGIQNLATGPQPEYSIGELKDLFNESLLAQTASELKAIKEVLETMLGVSLDIADHTDPILTEKADALIIAPVTSTIPRIYQTGSN